VSLKAGASEPGSAKAAGRADAKGRRKIVAMLRRASVTADAIPSWAVRRAERNKLKALLLD